MKLIKGHKYLRGANGDVVPYSKLMEKVSGYNIYIPSEDWTGTHQLAANENIKPASIAKATAMHEEKRPAPPNIPPEAPKVEPVKLVEQANDGLPPSLPVPVEPKKPQLLQAAPGKFQHDDITTEMAQDLSDLD